MWILIFIESLEGSEEYSGEKLCYFRIYGNFYNFIILLEMWTYRVLRVIDY